MAPQGGSILTKLTDGENVVLGMAAGVSSKMCNYPLLVWKNQVQQGQKIVLHPLKVYRGLPMACVNLGSVTALQFGLSGFFQKAFTGGEKRKLKPVEEITGAFLGGLISGVPCSIWELVMIQQQRFGGSISGTGSRLVGSQGLSVFLRGIIPTCGRESVFTMGMLGICPVVQEKAATMGVSDNVALATGALTASIISATLSHPLDTIKTCMQGDVEQNSFGNIRHTAEVIRADRGMPGFFKGLGYRIGLITTTFFLANRFKDILAPFMFSHAFKKEMVTENVVKI